MGIAGLFALLSTAGMVLLTNKHSDFCRNYRKQGLFLIVLVVSEMILVNVLKGIWARPRMRSIEDIDEFKHWFEIGGWTNDNELKSFPSGHTANAFVLLAFVVLTPMFKKIKVNHIIIASVIWGVLVGISRVVLGAHFLSDVLVGCYVTIYLFFGLYHLFFKNTPIPLKI
jgi:membrane-associated phospholipid phosphatase